VQSIFRGIWLRAQSFVCDLRGFFGERSKLICNTREQATQSGLRTSLIHILALLPCHPALEPKIHTRSEITEPF
jgi:hypothetical protein